MASDTNQTIVRATGVLVIEVKNSNPNGDPDRESDPRQRSHDQRGMITGVSFKRKLRDLVDSKDGEVWKRLGNGRNAEEHDILEARRHKRPEIMSLLTNNFEGFKTRFWDARVFGNTFLEEGGGDTIRTGVAQFALGISVAPIRIERLTNTKMAPAQGARAGGEAPTRGMAPLGYRVVEHGVYCLPFFINPTAATKTGCTIQDIELLLRLIRYAYPHTASHIRPLVEVRHAWYAEHSDPLGSFSEFCFIEAMTPKRKGNPEKPSLDNLPLEEQYQVPKDVPDDLKEKITNFCDLTLSLPDWCPKENNGSSRS
jgi:Cas7 group CRISPR-associated protein Csh2